MRIQRKVIKAIRVLAGKLFKFKPKPGASTGQSRLEPVTELHPCPDGTRLVVRSGQRSLSRILTRDAIAHAVSLPSQWLQACQGTRGDAEIVVGDNFAEFCWEDGVFPGRLQLALEPVDRLAELPPLAAVDVRLLAALAATSTAVDQQSLRYTLHCLQLDGERGTVTGTDGRQLLRYEGFSFPWNDKAILTPASAVFGCSELRGITQLACGVSDTQLVIEASPWRLCLPLELEGRYPNVEQIVCRLSQPTNRVYFDPRDLEFFAANVRHIPGADRQYAPLTIDLNGHVELTAAGDEQSPSVRIRLGRSVHVGPAVTCATNREYLHRAAKLGLTELLRFGESDPLVCRGDQITQLWQPLSEVAAPVDTPQTVKIDSLSARFAAA